MKRTVLCYCFLEICLHVLCCTSMNASDILTPFFGYNNIICTLAEWGCIPVPPLLPSSFLFALQHNQIPSRLLALHIGSSYMYLPDLGVIADHTLFLHLLWAFVCGSTRRAYLVALWWMSSSCCCCCCCCYCCCCFCCNSLLSRWPMANKTLNYEY